VAGIASDAGLEALALSDAGSAARITLNRPDKRNALSLELMDEPDAGAEDPRRAADVRAMVVGDREGAKAPAHCDRSSTRETARRPTQRRRNPRRQPDHSPLTGPTHAYAHPPRNVGLTKCRLRHIA
jgi:hypothetical protein